MIRGAVFRLLPGMIFCVAAFGLIDVAHAEDVMKSPSECDLHRQLSNAVPPECQQAGGDNGVKYRSIVVDPDTAGKAPPPVPAEPASTGPKAVNIMIQFEYNSSVLTQKAKEDLNRVASVLNHGVNNGSHFLVVGHTDATGGESYNIQLSRQRAESVASYLEMRGVEAKRLQTEGKGKAAPLDPAHPAAAINRRVEIINRG